MTKTPILFALALPLLAQQGFDLKTLDPLAANAKDKTEVTLDADMLKMAANFLGSDSKDSASIKSLVGNIKGIYVREYEYAKPGEYNETDLAALRAYLARPPWNKIVDSKEGKETSEVYMQPLPGNQLGGIAVISVEPKEVTVVFINGVLNVDDIAKLSGNMGVPDLKSLMDIKKPEMDKNPEAGKSKKQD
ncbi:MAG: DUF4252 domain-containing protein [Bryobacteraceae bacterium]|jgi:hypothetical protein